MKYWQLELKQAYKNLYRNKRRSLVTGLAILSGFVGLVLLAGYVARVERYLMVTTVYLNHNGHISIYKKDGIDKYFSRPSRYLLDPDKVTAVMSVLNEYKDDIEFTAPYMMANGLLQSGSKSFPFQGKGVLPKADEFTRKHQMVSDWTGELKSNEKGLPFYESTHLLNPIRITHRLSEALGDPKEVQILGLSVEQGLNALDSKVAGLYSTGTDLTEETSILASFNVLQELLATDGITNLNLYLENDVKARLLSYKLNNKFKELKLEVEAVPFFDSRIGLFYTGTMNFLYAMAAFFFTLVSLVVILSIANAISMNIIERIRELGTMRAIGFKPKEVVRLIAMESFLLSLVSIVIGFALAQLVAFAVNASNIRFYPPGIAGDMQFVLTPWPSICLLFALPLIALAVLTTIFVAKKKISGEVASLLSETTT